MATIPQTIFSDAFWQMKICVFWLKFHWSLFLGVQLLIIQHRFRFGTKLLSEPIWPDSLTHICDTGEYELKEPDYFSPVKTCGTRHPGQHWFRSPPVPKQAILWTNAHWSSIVTQWTRFRLIHKMRLKMSSTKWRQFLVLNVSTNPFFQHSIQADIRKLLVL